MKPVLGKSLRGKKTVSVSGLELGHVMDAYFDVDGKMLSLIVKPERATKETRDHIDRDGLMTVPFADVKAIGRYVIVDFPFTSE